MSIAPRETTDTPTRPDTRDWELWSTQCRLVVTDPACLDEASRVVDAELAAVEQACSRFRRDSELMTLVREGDGSTVLSPLLSELVAVALAAARDTDGAVDPTIGGALVGLGYDRDITLVRRGETSGPVVVRRVPGWRSLRLEGNRLRMPVGTQLDLGATAKARAADRCATLVAERLGTGVLVSLGGDISTAGPAPERGWQVTVQDLPHDVPQQITLAAGAGIATSSTLKRAWTRAGERQHHLLDPRTGAPSGGPWRTVTVVGPTCLAANVASTGALVRGDDAVAVLRQAGLPARLVSHDGSVATLGGWPREATT